MTMRWLLLFVLATLPHNASAELTWWFDPAGSDAVVPQNTLDRITAAMDEAVDYYNAYAVYERSDFTNDGVGVRVIYRSSVATANASYKGRIAFGGSISARTAMHELGHVFGVGTYRPGTNGWNDASNRNSSTNKWLGPAALAELATFNGDGAVLNADSVHFWPYGLNFGNEDSPTNRFRHVRMVGALRQDMGLPNGNATGLAGDYNNDGVVNAADYTIWRDAFDAALGAGAAETFVAQTPEPASLGLLAMTGLAGFVARRKRR